MVTSATGGETRDVLAQVALTIFMDLTQCILTGVGYDWQHLVSRLCVMLIAGRLSRVFTDFLSFDIE